MVDQMAADWEKPILDWKSKVDMSASIEEDIEKQIQTLDDTLDVLSDTPELTEVFIVEQEQLKESLKEHRETMHPSYYFIGDNVDLRTQVRQMTIKNQAKDYRMYNMCCYTNRSLEMNKTTRCLKMTYIKFHSVHSFLDRNKMISFYKTFPSLWLMNGVPEFSGYNHTRQFCRSILNTLT